jgi:hypothetical protein
MIEEYLLFLISIENKENSENTNSFLTDNFLLYEKIDISKINNMNDFIRFYYELKSINLNNDIDEFQIYDPIKGKSDLFVYKRNTNCENEKIHIFMVEPLIKLENIKLGIYEKSYEYLLFLFQGRYFDFKEENYKLFSKYFYGKEEYDQLDLQFDISIITKENDIYLCIFGEVKKLKAAIIEEKTGIVLFKFKLARKGESDKIDEENYRMDINEIIDQNIKIIFDNVTIINNKNFNILIDEPFNIIKQYFSLKHKKAKITSLSKSNNQNIKNRIDTNDKKEINTDICSYLNENEKENKKFDLIILFNVDEGFIGKDKVQLIAQHLKDKGNFCFKVFLENKYFLEKIEKEIKEIFNNVKIFRNHSDCVFICFKKFD